MRPVSECPTTSIDDHAAGTPRLTIVDADPAASDRAAGELLTALLAWLARGSDVRASAHVATALLAALRRLPLEAG